MPFAKTLHAIKSFTAIVLLYLTYNNALATNVVNIRTGSQTKNKTEIDLTNWKSRNADSAVFAGTNYNDSHWKLLNIEDLNNDDADGSVRWYRIHFIADSNMQNIPLAFFIRQFGSAAEFYLDGKLLKKSGVIGTSLQTEEAVLNLEPAHIIVVLNQKAHVLAIRCSDFHRVKSSNNGISIDGFTDFRFEKIEGDISDLVHYKKYFPFIFFTGLFVALFALHLVMYIFNRDKTVNAFYSMYCLGVAFISLYTYYIITSTSFNLVNSLTQIAISVLPLLVIPLVGLLHIIFYNKLGKLFITIICLYITLLLCMLFSGITAMVFTLILS
ncbi:MAG TPA: hypothetical protein PLO59_05495, partial [Bacteroidia bacterium]|nr:hypothetical protein [Bacteroidia bacterium]